jgi:hypothetical protein
MTDADRQHWARALTTAGWLSLLSYLAVLTVQLNRARQTTQSRFDGVWGVRIEQVSFASLPQNLVVLVPAAVAAVAASVVARGTVAELEVWLERLLRAVAGAAMLAVVLAALGIGAVVLGQTTSVGDFSYLINRLGGIALGAAMIRVCLAADRRSQLPRSPSR